MTDILSSISAISNDLSTHQSINQSTHHLHRRQRSKSDDRFDLQPINQSINQSITQSHNQPINQSHNQSIHQSINQPITPASTADTECEDDSPISNQSTNESTTPINQSINATNQSTPPTDQSINPNDQSTPTDQSINPPLKALMRQIEYYFSNQNLWKDAYLLSQMAHNDQSMIDISIIASLKKVAKLSTDQSMIIDAIKASNKLQLSDDQSMVKRIQPLPAYDQLKDAHRSLFVDGLPVNSTLKSVKKLFAIFGKVTYVLRADQIDSAAPLNQSPHGSPVINQSTPSSPMLMPRLSLGATHQSINVPSMSASDAIESPFTSAYVQFEKPQSMQRAVELINAIPKHTNQSINQPAPKNERILHISSPLLGRRTLGGSSSPIPSSRALSSHRTPSPIDASTNKSINQQSSNLLQKRGLGPSNSASPSQPKRRIGVQTNSIDLSTNDASPSPHSPMIMVDASTTPQQLPPVFATLTVMTKVDRLQHQSEDEEKKSTNQSTNQSVVKTNSGNWRNLNYSADQSINQSEDEIDEKPKSKSRRKPALLDENIIHISPKPSPRMSPATPIHAYPLINQSPGNSPALMGCHGVGVLPVLDLNKPRFTLAKRTSAVASHVASRFALGPDAPESRGFTRTRTHVQ